MEHHRRYTIVHVLCGYISQRFNVLASTEQTSANPPDTAISVVTTMHKLNRLIATASKVLFNKKNSATNKFPMGQANALILYGNNHSTYFERGKCEAIQIH